MIKTKRVYEKPERNDGVRILVERLWPRGIKKEDLKMNDWLKDLGASKELRKWYGHNPEKWKEFKKRYFKELKTKPEQLSYIRDAAKQRNITFLYSAKDTKHNNAVALKEYLDKKL